MGRTLLSVILLFSLSAQGWALENVASGTLKQQMDWSSLYNLFDRLKSELGIVTLTQQKILECQAKGMLYAPGGASSDANGCRRAVVDTTKLVIETKTFQPTEFPAECRTGIPCATDPDTTMEVCRLVGFAYPTGSLGRSYNSPGDNSVRMFKNSKWQNVPARSYNSWMYSITCQRIIEK